MFSMTKLAEGSLSRADGTGAVLPVLIDPILSTDWHVGRLEPLGTRHPHFDPDALPDYVALKRKDGFPIMLRFDTLTLGNALYGVEDHGRIGWFVLGRVGSAPDV